MSDALERAIDNMADELAAMGKAMSRDSKRIEQLQSLFGRLPVQPVRRGKRHGLRSGHGPSLCKLYPEFLTRPDRLLYCCRQNHYTQFDALNPARVMGS
jgi:hypothetical protein